MKRALIIAIGEELLNGSTSDTNSQWLKEKLSDYNLEVSKSIIIPDNSEMIKKEIVSSFDYNFVFISGGLGPTHDDITKKAIAEALNLKMNIDEKHRSKLIERYPHIKKSDVNNNTLDSQCLVIDGFNGIYNKIGTAIGLTKEIDKTRFFILPGVPREFRNMLSEQILPLFLIKNKLPTYYTLKTTGITESKLYSNLEDYIKSYRNKFEFAFLPHFTGVNIRIKAKRNGLLEVVEELKELLGKYYYGCNDDTLEEVVAKKISSIGLTVSVAESCTGGLLTKKLTDFSGSSKFLRGSIVAYSNDIKEKILGIPKKIIDEEGAVSEKVALEMSNNISRDFDTDLGISITGISGPTGGTPAKPVGLYYISIKHKDIHFVKRFLFSVNDRNIHRNVVATTALNMIRLFLDKTKHDYISRAS